RLPAGRIDQGARLFHRRTRPGPVCRVGLRQPPSANHFLSPGRKAARPSSPVHCPPFRRRLVYRQGAGPSFFPPDIAPRGSLLMIRSRVSISSLARLGLCLLGLAYAAHERTTVAAPIRMAVMGDSISAGNGVSGGSPNWVAQLKPTGAIT